VALYKHLVRQSDSNSARKRMILQAAMYPTREMYAQSYAQFAPVTPTLGPRTILAVRAAHGLQCDVQESPYTSPGNRPIPPAVSALHTASAPGRQGRQWWRATDV